MNPFIDLEDLSVNYGGVKNASQVVKAYDKTLLFNPPLVEKAQRVIAAANSVPIQGDRFSIQDRLVGDNFPEWTEFSLRQKRYIVAWSVNNQVTNQLRLGVVAWLIDIVLNQS